MTKKKKRGRPSKEAQAQAQAQAAKLPKKERKVVERPPPQLVGPLHRDSVSSRETSMTELSTTIVGLLQVRTRMTLEDLVEETQAPIGDVARIVDVLAATPVVVQRQGPDGIFYQYRDGIRLREQVRG
eukprot:g6597.t1